MPKLAIQRNAQRPSQEPVCVRRPASRKATRGATIMTLQEFRSGVHMLDIALLALGLGFFAVTVGYAYACERL